jgi:ABC-type amino acid transport substrate-binding protein
MKLPADMAVYAEHSDTRKDMGKAWTPRIFNRTEVLEGSAISVNDRTGVISLGPGVYRITGSSAVTYNDLTDHPDEPGWNTKAIPNGGYCRLRHAADGADCGNEKAIVVGTISNANMLPSFIDTWLDVPEKAELVLEHQVGDLVEGIYLQDDTQHSSWHVFARVAIHRVGDSSVQHEPSPLGSVFDAALRTYLADPERYRRLYGTYLGVVPKLVPPAGEGAWTPASDPALARVLRRGVLRFGYSESPPYVYHEDNGELAGLDWELGNALAEIIRDQYFHAVPGRGLRAEWVKVQVQPAADPEAARFDALYRGLRTGRFDIAMSGQADISATGGATPWMRDVDWTSPTALLFTNVLYTGLDDHDLSELVGASRERFIATVARWPEVVLMCVQNPGPSPGNARELIDAINAAGGLAELRYAAELDDMTAAISTPTIHFSVGDAVASSWIGNQPGFPGLNLNVAASTRPLQTAQPVAAFTLRAT